MPEPLPDHGLILTRGAAAVITSADGSISGEGATGVYVRDRRVVAGLSVTVNGAPLVLLGETRTGPSSDRLTFGYWQDAPDPRCLVVRDRRLGERYVETLAFRSFAGVLDLKVEVSLVSADATVYSLRERSDVRDDAALLARLFVDDEPTDELAFTRSVVVSPDAPVSFDWGLTLDVRVPPAANGATIATSDSQFQRTLDYAAWDLEALSVLDEKTGAPFVAAGSPHFLALFGRDGQCAASLAKLANPRLALDTLKVLAAYQGERFADATVEEPGRIVHELRIGDMGVFGLAAGVPYYGSIDATPLFVVGLAEELAWRGATSDVTALLPHARRAMDWCRTHVDRFGFVVSTPHDAGISNQSWKDSYDAFVRSDGTVVEGATSPVEVQGYVHQALVGLAELEEAVGDAEAAGALRDEARDFAARFREHFVVDDERVLVALALDEHGAPLVVRASNVGHLLATELIDDELAARIADRLMDDDEFSGWGIRTLAASEPAYNPLGYHIGSVWPHDTALALRGLVHRRFDAHARRLAAALVELAAAEHHQLPELLGGQARSEFGEPIRYPASGRPQAWAAAVPFAIVQSLLGLRPAMHRNTLMVRPLLEGGQSLAVRDLRLGDRLVTIEALGRSATVTGDTDGLDVIIETAA